MPLYTYQCSSCAHIFDAIHSISSDKPPCPECKDKKVAKYFGATPTRSIVPQAPKIPPVSWTGDQAFLAAGILLPDKGLSLTTLEPFKEALHACNKAFPRAELVLFATEPAENVQRAIKDKDGAFRTAIVLGRIAASVSMDRLIQIDPQHCINILEQLREQHDALAFLRGHSATPPALADILHTEQIAFWLGYNDAECCFFDLFYGSIFPKEDDVEEKEQLWRRNIPSTIADQLDKDFCGEHWDDPRRLIGKRLASTRFKISSQPQQRREPRRVELTKETLNTLESDVKQHLSNAAMYLNELTFYWH